MAEHPSQSWFNDNISNFEYIAHAAETERSWHMPLYRAILQGNWENAKLIFENESEAITARFTAFWETPLFVAVKGGQGMGLIQKLVDLMPPESLALPDYFGNTALHVVALLGNVKAAKLFVDKNSDLPNIWNNDGLLPLHLAAMHGQRKMTLYLFSVTREDEESSLYADEAGGNLMNFAMNAGFYDLALYLLRRNPKLAWLENSPLEVMAQEPSAFPSFRGLNIWQQSVYSCIPIRLTKVPEILNHRNVRAPADQSEAHSQICWGVKMTRRKHFISGGQKLYELIWKILENSVPPPNYIHWTKLMHYQALQLVKSLCREITSERDIEKAASVLRRPFLLGAQNGIHEIVKEILESFPRAITFVDEENHSAFHLAVMYRHEKVFNIMHRQSGQNKLFLSLLPDNKRNNILHLAGHKAQQNQIDSTSGTILQMQRELLWFREVEKFVLPQERKSKNSDGKTPLMVFNEEHKDLVAYEGGWMMSMATACTVAASLIGTVVFAAAITVPGGNNNDGLPIFSKERAFKIFAISDAIALLSSITTVLTFLSIFTSRYAVTDFLYALPKRLIIGLIALFLAVISMMIAFTSTLFLVFARGNASIMIPLVTLACLPVALFAVLQLPPLLNMIKSTYGPSIFSK